MFYSLQEEVNKVSKALPVPDENADESELLKEKVLFSNPLFDTWDIMDCFVDYILP